MTATFTFSLQQVQVAAWNGNGTYGTPVIGESTKTLSVAVKYVSDRAQGNAVITALASQIISADLTIDTAGFDNDVLAILWGVSASSSGAGTNVDIGDTIVCTMDDLFDQDGVPLYNQYWQVVAVKPDYTKNKVNFRALQLPGYLFQAYLADGSYVADGSAKAGTSRDTTLF